MFLDPRSSPPESSSRPLYRHHPAWIFYDRLAPKNTLYRSGDIGVLARIVDDFAVSLAYTVKGEHCLGGVAGDLVGRARGELMTGFRLG